MAHSWESPLNCAREALLETLADRLPDPVVRQAIIELVIEEVDRQFAEPDDDMVVAGQEVLDASGGTLAGSLFYRRRVVEAVWRAMVEKAFGR